MGPFNEDIVERTIQGGIELTTSSLRGQRLHSRHSLLLQPIPELITETPSFSYLYFFFSIELISSSKKKKNISQFDNVA